MGQERLLSSVPHRNLQNFHHPPCFHVAILLMNQFGPRTDISGRVARTPYRETFCDITVLHCFSLRLDQFEPIKFML